MNFNLMHSESDEERDREEEEMELSEFDYYRLFTFHSNGVRFCVALTFYIDSDYWNRMRIGTV